MQNRTQLLSVVVPVYFEELVLEELYKRLKKVLINLKPNLSHEIIFVNDGSTDKSLEILKKLSCKDNSVRVIDFSRNFGHQIAVTAGIEHARGDAVVVIDDDLQDPPEVITEMVVKWKEGYQVVNGVRSKRKGENFLKIITSKIFYRLLGKLSDIKIPADVGDFRLMSRQVVDSLKLMPEKRRYIRGMIAWVGFSQCNIKYERDPRYAGKTKYTLKKQLSFALDGITSFSDRPLRYTANFGLLITFTSFLGMLWILYNKLFIPSSSVQGWTSLTVIILFLGGAQLTSLGILGEYISRIFHETKDRPLYIIAKKYGFSDVQSNNVNNKNTADKPCINNDELSLIKPNKQ